MFRLSPALLAVALMALLLAPGAAAGRCADGYPAQRDPANPLDLPQAPGRNPLRHAHFFVDGPRHGSAAGAIARLLGMRVDRFPDSYSWARLRSAIDHGRFRRRLRHPGIAYRVRMLEKVADQQEPQRFSRFSMGGGRGAIYAQVQKVLCGNLRADPGAVPVISTYFLYQAGYCESAATIRAHRRTFQRQVNEMITGIGRHPVVLLLEIDGIGASSCEVPLGGLREWERNIRYEVDRAATLPHAVVYVEAGYSDAEPAGYAARVLNAVDVRRIRGFFTNDTHMNWASHEAAWGRQVSRLTGGAHFIVNTAQDGQGPLLNPHPVRQGIENLCNPPGRGLGRRTSTSSPFPRVDALMWTHVPGNSSGCGGGPPGVFWPARAIDLASRANGRLGPGYPSRPY